MGARTLRVHLAPQQLLAVVCRGGRPLDASTVRVAIDNPTGHWQPAVDALRAWLARAGQTGAGLPLELSLAGRWCQMLVAPWSDALLTEAGATRFLQTQLAALYGDAARGWSVAADDAPYGLPRLVCGIDATLLADLRAATGARCHAIEPAISVVLRTLMASRPQALAVVEAGRLTLAALTGDRITAIASQPCGAAWHGELVQAWQRWTLRTPELTLLAAPLTADIAVVDLSGANLRLARTAGADVLPPPFRLADSPFGTVQAPGAAEEAA
ncbi:hypothetical protein H3H37_21100 [Duganella sp. LX20W]|uniref:Uncharacterized protein n=1 Tax=Rugamonas brunnea TaxID=2758569 RepID=A0A7W2EVW1_9BURK|nr:hypothetical protein [Rugamonas brunnea]MBA5639559.1 hypothetical protein [Rugamonas brunnea]